MKKYLMATLAVLALAFAAPMSAADAGELTVTGTVVSSTADSVVVRTPEGEKTFVINMLTDEPDDLTANSQVTIRYKEEDGRLIAKEITMGSSSATTDTSASATTPPPVSGTGSDDMVGDVGADTAASSANEPGDATADTSASASASATYSDPSATTGTYTDRSAATTTHESSRTDVDVTNVQDDTDYDDTTMATTDTGSAEALPATATKLPLLALIGLVLLAAGLAIRIAR
jgi:hypothetical protein